MASVFYFMMPGKQTVYKDKKSFTTKCISDLRGYLQIIQGLLNHYQPPN